MDRLRRTKSSAATGDLRTQTIAEFRTSVWNDLRNLLNTRWPMLTWPEEYTELDTSLLNYGIPDFAGFNLNSADDKERLRSIIEQAIRRFEPRFVSVSVTVQPNKDPLDRVLRLQIKGKVFAYPEPVALGFDPVVDPLNCTIDLKDTHVG
jgi:type VI secretion system protein ImpF